MTWTDGRWSGARRLDAHQRRLGGAIVPRCVVVHTTDMHPAQYNGLLRNWTMGAGNGACAHFLIAREQARGVVQFAPITLNANHAGGAVHGWYRFPVDGVPGGGQRHPNVWAVGIELEGAGALCKRPDGVWYHPDTNLVIPYSDVYVDSRGRGWHAGTDYQREALGALLSDLQPELVGLPPGTTVKPDGDYQANGVPWAATVGPRVAGHVTLDPVNKTDPGPQWCAWLAALRLG